MRRITKRMAREIERNGFVRTGKYEYYESICDGSVYRIPIEIADTTEATYAVNNQFVCSHEELCDLAF